MDVGRTQKRVTKTWHEQDLYTSWRHLLHWQRGERKWVKRFTHKSERRQAGRLIAEDRAQG